MAEDDKNYEIIKSDFDKFFKLNAMNIIIRYKYLIEQTIQKIGC